jgi:hypothetical protein
MPQFLDKKFEQYQFTTDDVVSSEVDYVDLIKTNVSSMTDAMYLINNSKYKSAKVVEEIIHEIE